MRDVASTKAGEVRFFFEEAAPPKKLPNVMLGHVHSNSRAHCLTKRRGAQQG